MDDIYTKIDKALKDVDATRTRRPILDLLADAWEEGFLAGQEGESHQQDDNPYRSA